MNPPLDWTVALLRQTPSGVDALLRWLPAQWSEWADGEGGWSAKEVVAHLAHADRTDWMPRIRTILQYGDTRDFPPFDREGFRESMPGRTMGEVLDDFARARDEALKSLIALNLQEPDLTRDGRHPVFGRVTLGQLLATWAAHDLNHLHQIARVLVHPYRQPVGPWSRYLGVMQYHGHGEKG